MKSRNVRESLFLAALFTSFIAPRAEATSNFVPWIDKPIGGALQFCEVAIAVRQDNKIACAGKGKKVAGPSEVDYALVLFFDLHGRTPNPESKLALPETLLLESSKPGPSVAAAKISLQPPSIPTAAGSGTSLTSNATCAVGYQDAGFQTPYHAFRWTEAGGPVDLGTLVPASNSTLSSFAWDTSADCDTVVGFSDLNGGLLQHAFRWTQAAGMVASGHRPVPAVRHAHLRPAMTEQPWSVMPNSSTAARSVATGAAPSVGPRPAGSLTSAAWKHCSSLWPRRFLPMAASSRDRRQSRTGRAPSAGRKAAAWWPSAP